MTLRELSIAGVLFSPLVPLAFACWFALLALRAVLRRLGLADTVWHPPLVMASLLVLLFCGALWVLAFALDDGRG